LYESFERATCVLAQPQLPFSKFVTEPWHTTGLTLSASVVSESSWVWPVASDYLLIGQRFRPAYQSGAKAYIWGGNSRISNMRPSNRLIKTRNFATRTPRVYLRQPTVWKWLYADPDRTFRHQCRQQQRWPYKTSTRQPTQKCGRSPCLFPVANRIRFFQVRGPDSRSKCYHSPSSVSCPPCFSIHLQPRRRFVAIRRFKAEVTSRD
jgi:hypothetical protein